MGFFDHVELFTNITCNLVRSRSIYDRDFSQNHRVCNCHNKTIYNTFFPILPAYLLLINLSVQSNLFQFLAPFTIRQFSPDSCPKKESAAHASSSRRFSADSGGRKIGCPSKLLNFTQSNGMHQVFYIKLISERDMRKYFGLP